MQDAVVFIEICTVMFLGIFILRQHMRVFINLITCYDELHIFFQDCSADNCGKIPSSIFIWWQSQRTQQLWTVEHRSDKNGFTAASCCSTWYDDSIQSTTLIHTSGTVLLKLSWCLLVLLTFFIWQIVSLWGLHLIVVPILYHFRNWVWPEHRPVHRASPTRRPWILRSTPLPRLLARHPHHRHSLSSRCNTFCCSLLLCNSLSHYRFQIIFNNLYCTVFPVLLVN